MGTINHIVTRLNPTALIAVMLASLAAIQCASLIAEAIKPSQVTVNLQIDNKGKVKAFEIINGNLVPLK